MNFPAFCLAVFVLVNVGDRLRLINWRTGRWTSVAGLLALGMGSLAVIHDAFTTAVDWWQWLLLILAVAWLHLTRPAWRSGVPESVKTSPAELGHPELESRQ